jgi:prepilin-type processing-associated H-X9-DG protein
MSSRETGRRLSCAANLRQIGMGLESFESANGSLPGVFWGLVQPADGREKVQVSFSPSSLIAGFIDSDALAASVPIRMPNGSSDSTWSSLDLSAPGILRCPADALATGMDSSYRYCRGNLPLWPGDPGGCFVRPKGVRLAAITDGLASTAFASERLISNPASTWGFSRNRDLMTLGTSAGNDTARMCVTANLRGVWDFSLEPAGISWLSGRRLDASYYHLFPPNSGWVDCVPKPPTYTPLTSARSNHAGGVNVLFGDGHATFVSNSIELEIWRAWATRSGSETVGD